MMPYRLRYRSRKSGRFLFQRRVDRIWQAKWGAFMGRHHGWYVDILPVKKEKSDEL